MSNRRQNAGAFCASQLGRYTYLVISMEYQTDEIRDSLRKAFLEMGIDQEKIETAIFHLVDWLKDLNKWNAFCENPKSINPEETSKLVLDFLIHVPNHLAAASKLVLDIPVSDVFEVGATSEEKT